MKRKEKRAHKRYEVREVQVEYSSSNRFVKDFLKNISHGGVFIETLRPAKPGTILNIRFTIPGQKVPLRVKGEVVWTAFPKEVRKRKHKPGMGIKFVDLTERKKKRIKTFIRKILEKQGNKGDINED